MSQSQEVERLRALVDSLTAERDEAREQNRLATIDWANTAAELDAAEAEVKRLREAVAKTWEYDCCMCAVCGVRFDWATDPLGGPVVSHADGCVVPSVLAALATPPSEGGAGNG